MYASTCGIAPNLSIFPTTKSEIVVFHPPVKREVFVKADPPGNATASVHIAAIKRPAFDKPVFLVAVAGGEDLARFCAILCMTAFDAVKRGDLLMLAEMLAYVGKIVRCQFYIIVDEADEIGPDVSGIDTRIALYC